jgi:hypothetical protein
MRRRARVIHLARLRLDSLLVRLKSTPAAEWSENLKPVWELLRSISALNDSQRLSVVIHSVSAAHACAKAINRRSDSFFEFQTRGKLRNAFKRVANCARRAPLKLRRRLNERINPLIRETPVDLEVIEAILDAVVGILFEFTNEEAARTALRTMCHMPPGHDPAAKIKDAYSTLSNSSQRKAEIAIAAVANVSKRKTTASDVFHSLASALESKNSNKPNPEINLLIEQYVAAVAKIWRDVGLRPSRARHPDDPKYKSKFHSFVDLVLTALVEPQSNRHTGNLDEIGRKTREVHAEMPKDFRGDVTPRLRRSDIEWLVTDAYVKKALHVKGSKNRL